VGKTDPGAKKVDPGRHRARVRGTFTRVERYRTTKFDPERYGRVRVFNATKR
jgi:hypothetical protein